MILPPCARGRGFLIAKLFWEGVRHTLFSQRPEAGTHAFEQLDGVRPRDPACSTASSTRQPTMFALSFGAENTMPAGS